jgi:hypothetical protein
MSWGNLGAAPGAQPTSAQPTGAPIFANQPGPLSLGTVAAGAVQGQAGANPNGASAYFNAGFESIMAAVSRGEISLNQVIAAGNQFGGVAGQAGSQLGNPTLLQAFSQSAVAQNATNAIGVVCGPGVAVGNVSGIGGAPSGNSGLNGTPIDPAGGGSQTSFSGTQPIDAKQMANSSGVTLQFNYGGA